MLPKALVIGPMKSGTTWIHEYLATRGDVCLPRTVKETFFFDYRYSDGLRWYARHFSHYDQAVHNQVAEVAPSLFHSGMAPERVRQTLGPVRLVVTWRDPVERAWSHYLHIRRRGFGEPSLERTVELYPEIVTASRYMEQTARWHSILPKAQFYWLSIDTLKNEPLEYTRQLCDALQIPFVHPCQLEFSSSNSASVPASFWLARVGYLSSRTLRRWDMYWVVNLAKHIGLKSIFFGNPSQAGHTRPEHEDIVWLRDQIGEL